MFSSMAQSSTEVHSAPDCEMNATWPGFGSSDGEARVQHEPWYDDSEAVGADDAHAVESPLLGPDRFLEGPTPFTHLAEAGRDDHDSEDSRLAARADDAGDLPGGGANHGQVGAAGESGDVGVGLDPEDRLDRRVDRIDDAPETGAHEIAKNRAADALRILACPEEDDALRLEDRIELVDVHGFPSTLRPLHMLPDPTSRSSNALL